MVVRAVYEEFCSNCGGSIEDERLVSIGVCKNCLQSFSADLTPREVANQLKSLKKYRDYKIIAELEEKIELFKKEFNRATGFQPWSLQEVWAKRVLLDENFTIVAPTGVGKTLFCVVMALFLAKHFDRRCYLILPSSMLVEQVTDKALNIAEKIGLTPNLIAYYHAGLPKLKREEMLKRIESGEYKLLITTDRFLVDRIETIRGTVFDNIFVDDVDSFLKSPKNIDKVVSLLGFDPSVLDTVFRIIEVRRRLTTQSSVDLWREYEELRKIIEKEKNKKHGKLVVTGATLKTKKSKRIYVFSELLGFELGTKPEFIRNIVDFYIKVDGNLEEKTIELVKKYGGGGLVFVPLAFGREYAKKLAERFKDAGIKPYFYEKMEEDILDKFEAGEYDVLVGMATSRSPLARGIDLPKTIRYAIFVGVPRREIKLRRDESNPNKIHALLTNILDVFDEKDKLEAVKLLQKLGKIVPVPKEIVAQLEEAFEKGVKLDGYAGYIQQLVEQSRKILDKVFVKEILDKIVRETDVMVKVFEDGLSLIIPDTSGYIQASGRTSRLFAQGISRGVSIILVDDIKTFTGLTRRLRIILDEFDWVEYNKAEVEKAFREVDRDRELIKEIGTGRITTQIKDLIKAALMIVESPTKAKTFARFFGRPHKRMLNNIPIYETSTSNLVLNIVATMGHVTDLSMSHGIHGVLEEEGRYIPVFTSIKRCDKCGYSFVESDECPSCGSRDISSKKEIIDVLRRLALEVNEVYIATDPDAEGEKIAYDICVAISPYNKNIYRLEFHEVTRKALLNALANKKPISVSLVEAQLVRRIEDRWLGFELSRKLWDRFGYRTLSAGRVQTPVLGWVIERHVEHKKKKELLYVLLENGLEVVYENPKNLEEIIKKFKENSLRAEVSSLVEEVRDVNPPPPYTTDSLLKDAFTQLGLPVVQTMSLAQELFENGLITYHRTDSTTVSTAGLNLAKEYIESNNLGAFTPRTFFKEGAHECIRPVKPLDLQRLSQYLRIGLIKPTVKLTDKHLKLYDLIFRRFIASQMTPAKITVQRYSVRLDSLEVEVEKNVEIIEQGFNTVFPTIRTGKRVSEGTYLVKSVEVRKIPSVPLYSEGDIIALMKERGIGRPSTYSRIVQILFERGYVFEKRGKLIPTSRGITVYRYLKENFGEYVSEEVTRQLEEVMDRIEAGEINYQEVLRELKKQVEAIRAVKVIVDQPR